MKAQDKVIHFIAMRKGTEKNPIYDRFMVDLNHPINVADDGTIEPEGG